MASAIRTFEHWLLRFDKVWLTIGLAYLGLYIALPYELWPTAEFAAQSMVQTGPFILFAALLVGWLRATGADHLVANTFKTDGYSLILMASFIGGLSPFCSCEVIPFVSALLIAGVPISAVMAFWLSSPLMDPVILSLTAAELDWDFAIGKLVAAISVGLFGGLVVKSLVGAMPDLLQSPLKANRSSCNSCCASPALNTKPNWSFWKDAARRTLFRSEASTNALFLLKWLALAYTIEALMIRYIPAELVASYVGGEGLLPILTAAFIGAPAYLNGYAAPALVSAFISQGMGVGAAMAFLVAGGITSIPAMTAVFALVRLPIFALYLGLGYVGACLSGLLFAAAMSYNWPYPLF